MCFQKIILASMKIHFLNKYVLSAHSGPSTSLCTSTQQWKKMERAPIFEDLVENTPIVHKMMRSATQNPGKNKRVGWSCYFISLNDLKLLIFLHHFFLNLRTTLE